jgi:hypothetical protein
MRRASDKSRSKVGNTLLATLDLRLWSLDLPVNASLSGIEG